jgi:23S rRNA pseudouridine2605 synthase/23S rRNA pseudouridine2604 synthase
MNIEMVRLQKYMSGAWICSRRKAEEYITAGQVFVNGEKAHLGQSVNPNSDVVTLWKWAEMSQQKYVYYKYNKPRGVESTCAQKDGQSIIDIIDVKERVFPVGRLDKDSTWLIILSNDGRMTNYLTHPRYGHEKEYVVETFWSINNDQLEKMSEWILILWKRTKKCKVERIAAGKFSIVLTEWKNRQIRRMVEEVWSKVKKLKRIRIENIVLDGLQDGQIKHLSAGEKNVLFKTIGLDDV